MPLSLIAPVVVLLFGAMGATLAHSSGRATFGLAAAICAPAALAAAVLAVFTSDVPPIASMAAVLTTAVAALVAAYSRRHLDGDPRQSRYEAFLLLVAAAALVAGTADSLVVLGGAWVVTGLVVVPLIAHHENEQASLAARRAWRVAQRVGDTALVGAIGLLVAGTHHTDMAAAARLAAQDPRLATASGALTLIAVTARCGLMPFHRWLPLSVVAPAPVSALLHAGVVNGPLFVLLGLAPLWEAQPGLRVALAVVAGGSALMTFPRLLVRPDAKTRLAWSTSAQMGFMVVQVAVGAPGAAAVHLVAHAAYKANAFLGAGSQISASRARRASVVSGNGGRAGAAIGMLFTAAAVLVLGGLRHPLTMVPLVIAATAAGHAIGRLQASAGVKVCAGAIAAAAVAAVTPTAEAASTALGLRYDAAGPLAWSAAGLAATYAALWAFLRARGPVRVWAWLHRLGDPVTVRRGNGGPLRITLVPTQLTNARRNEVLHDVARAGAAIPPTWDWRRFIAANPLLGFEDLPFGEGVAAAQDADAQRTLSVVDSLVAGWMAAWSDAGDTAWPARRGAPLWQWFLSVPAAADPVFRHRARVWLAAMPSDAAAVVAAVAEHDGLDVHTWATRELAALPGWAAYMARQAGGAAIDADALTQLLAVHAATRYALGAELPPTTDPQPEANVLLWLDNLERTEERTRHPVLRALSSAATGPQRATERADADLVFCIDARSEVLRRHLEARGRYRTIGAAGFFALPLQLDGGSRAIDQCPVLFPASVPVSLQRSGGAGVAVALRAALRAGLDAPGGGFGAVDLGGLLAFGGIFRTVAPQLQTARVGAATAVAVTDSSYSAVRDLVITAGLYGPQTAALVVLVGHGSTSANNPAEAAFDCGACGGNRGGLNAQVAAQLLNDPGVRARLAVDGFALPDGVTVIAMEHDTATDVVSALGELRGALDSAQFLKLRTDLAAAGHAAAQERCRFLPRESRAARRTAAGNDTAGSRAVARRAADWAEVRHEWGLAGAAFFIAAPRALTRDLDLGGRAFLHDYEVTADLDGDVLAAILGGPLVVAEWITLQYLFSSAFPEQYSAGSKTGHNPVGGIGVLTGPSGDLRVGLATQSTHYGDRVYLEPTRLCAVVAAGTDLIDVALSRQPHVGKLAEHGWISLYALDMSTGAVLKLTSEGWHTARPHPEPSTRLARGGEPMANTVQ